MKVRFIDFAGLFLLVLVTGLFWGTWFSLSRSIYGFSHAEFIHIGKVIIGNVAMPMRVIMPLCIGCMGLSAWYYPAKKSTGFYMSIIALVLIVASLIITVGIEVPIDNMIKTWTPATIPSNFDELRNKWEFFHGMRTITSLGSFAFYSLALFSLREKLA